MAAIIPAVVLPRHIKDLTVSTVHHQEPQVMLGGRHAVPINTAHFLIEVAHPPLAAPVAQRASRERAESRPPGWLLQSSCGVPADWQLPAPTRPGRPAQADRTPERSASPSRAAKIPLCATCIGSPPVNEVIGRDQED